jgi:hypothetical protein
VTLPVLRVPVLGVRVGRGVLARPVGDLVAGPGLGEAEGDAEIVDGVMRDHIVPLRSGLVEDPSEEDEDIIGVLMVYRIME